MGALLFVGLSAISESGRQDSIAAVGPASGTSAACATSSAEGCRRCSGLVVLAAFREYAAPDYGKTTLLGIGACA